MATGLQSRDVWRTLRLTWDLLRLYVAAISLFTLLVVALWAVSLLLPGLRKIPAPILAGALAIAALAFLWGARMIRERNIALSYLDTLHHLFGGIDAPSLDDRWAGLDEEALAPVLRRARALPGALAPWWRNFADHLVLHQTWDGRRGWFLSRPAAEILPAERFLTSFFHFSFYHSVPPILTALGLMGTFVAILLALAGVSYNPADRLRPVSGIDSLINGLSGKFLISIVALLLSVIYTLVERRLCERQLDQRYRELMDRADSLFPILTPVRVLADRAAQEDS